MMMKTVEKNENLVRWLSMKKAISIILFVFLLAAACIGQAEEVEGSRPGTFMDGDFEYFAMDEETAMIAQYYGDAEELTIPGTIGKNNYTVTTIWGYAFADCTSLTSVVIPDSVTTIGDLACADCTSLTQIVIPEGVNSIGCNAFCECEALLTVNLPNTLKCIGHGAFSA